MPRKVKPGQFLYWREAAKSEDGFSVTARSLAGTGIIMRNFSEMNDLLRKMLADYEHEFKQLGFDPDTIEFNIRKTNTTTL